MAQRGDVAAMRGAPTLSQREECAKGMVRWCRRNVVATRGAPSTPKGEDSAMGMENISARESRYVAAMMDAPANPEGKEFARSTVRSLSSPPRGKWSCPLRLPRVPRTRPRLPWREEGWKSKCTIRPMTRNWVRGFGSPVAWHGLSREQHLLSGIQII